MGCNVTISGIFNECEASKGGVLAAIFMNKVDSIDAISNSNYFGNYTVDTSKVTAATAKLFEPNRDTSSFTSTLNVDNTNGIKYVSTEIILQFNRMSFKKRAELNNVLKGEWTVFIQDANKQWYCFGWKDFDVAYASAGTGQTGGAKSDGNYYQITLTAETSMFPCPTDDNATIEALNSIVKKTDVGPTPERLEFNHLSYVDYTGKDSNGVSITADSSEYSVVPLQYEYSSSVNHTLYVRVKKNAYSLSSGKNYYSTNKHSSKPGANDYDLMVSYSGLSDGVNPNWSLSAYKTGVGSYQVAYFSGVANNTYMQASVAYNSSRNWSGWDGHNFYVYEENGVIHFQKTI